jgi:eukaryotic-like serine/threonine-protein kinase
MTVMEAGSVVANSIRLVKPLGEGGMGSVWLADHLALETQVVVKFMHQALGQDATSRERFSREAVAASKVKSPHVVQTFDHGVTPDGTAFIVMERLDGEDLAHRIERGPLSPKEATLVMTQTCRALARAHGAGIVHRDIKPDNIFLCDVGADEPFVKLLDFGIAKASLNPNLDNKTRTGAMMGTPYYMSPEQFAGAKDIDLRTDLWSMGIVAFECLTGRRPFDADTIGGLAIAVHSGELPLPSQVRPDLQPFDDWFKKACARKPAERFTTAKEFAESFDAVARGVGMIAGAPAAPAFATQGFSATSPEGIPAVPPALLLSTGATGAVATPTATLDPGMAPVAGAKSGGSKVVIFGSVGALAVIAVAAATLVARGSHPAASPLPSEPARPAAAPAAPPPPAPVPAPKPPEAEAQRLAPVANDIPSAAPAAPEPASTVTTRATAPKPTHQPVHATAAPAAAKPASAPAAPTRPAANCNPPYTVDGAGVKHPKMECL